MFSILVLYGFHNTENYFTQGMRILPTPDNQGLFVIDYLGIHKLFCSKYACELTELDELSYLGPRIKRIMGPVAMYIGKELVKCA